MDGATKVGFCPTGIMKIKTTIVRFGMKIVLFVGLALVGVSLSGQTATLKVLLLQEDSSSVDGGIVLLEGEDKLDAQQPGNMFKAKGIPYGAYSLIAFAFGKELYKTSIVIDKPVITLTIILNEISSEVNAVEVQYERERTFGITRLKGVEGTAIYEAKKTEVVVLKDLTANLSTNNPRQIYSKVTGLNIWESDMAGLQLGIGGRGLSPNRTSNFNTRQNGYDISADALGYPESYYTPPAEALERIEVVRGAASLQYGTQFGGMLNFVMKSGPVDKKLEVSTRQTFGSYGYFGSYNSAGGTVGKVSYYAFFQHKKAEGWRENSGFYSNTAYAKVAWQQNSKITHTFEVTTMGYLARQPGGLTDANFAENPRESFRERNWFAIRWNLFAWQMDYKLSENTTFNWRTFGLLAERKSLGNLERINVADFGENRTLIAGKFNNIGQEGRLLKHYKTGKKQHTGVFGYRAYYGQTTTQQGEASNGVGPDFTFLNPGNLENSDYTFPNFNGAVFIENIFNLSEKTSITPGIRFEYINTKSEGYYKQRVYDAAGNLIVDRKLQDVRGRVRSFFIGGVGVKHIPTKRVELYANFSQNYRAINFSDLRVINPNFIVDTAIQDEKGFTADLGIRGGRTGWYTYEITAFYILYRGRIGQLLRADIPPLYIDYRYRTNVADAQNVGIEMMCEADILKLFTLSAQRKNSLNLFTNLAFVDARYINTEDNTIKGNSVEMVPQVMLRTGINYRRGKRVSVSAQYSYTGEHFSDATNATLTSTAVEGLIKSYSVVDISCSVYYRKYSLDLSCNNLFNSYYFTRRAESYPGPGIIPADGRTIFITLGAVLGK